MHSLRCVRFVLTGPRGVAEISSDSLKGRVYELNLADLQKDEDQSFRKISLKCEEISGSNCLTSFYGMDMTRDKLCSLVRLADVAGWRQGVA